MDYFQNFNEKSEKNDVFEFLGNRPLCIHNMKKIKICRFNEEPSPAFRHMCSKDVLYVFSQIRGGTGTMIYNRSVIICTSAGLIQ